MKLIVNEFMTLDGVMEAPGYEEHRAGRNTWAMRVSDEELQGYNHDMAFSTDAFLFGRTTYNIWAAFWPTGPDAGGVKDLISTRPKYVVSKTLGGQEWQNTTVLRGDLREEVQRLKEHGDGNLVVYGSADLVDSLLDLDLIDELRILLFPVILGSGKRLFRDDIRTHHLRLISSRTFPSGVVLMTYDRQAALAPEEDAAEFAWTAEQIESLRAAEDTDRILATVLFTDIVDSTSLAANLGDRDWHRLLDRHDHAARMEVERWRGQLVKHTGDGILAKFDTPTKALRCAFGLRSAMARLDIKIRVAIHSGEVEVRLGDLGGIGVHIAARALEHATGGQVIVTRTVCDLAAGTDLEFRSIGTVALRGVPGQWGLFAASLR